ncbi:MAG: hypothetical protein ABSB25_03570 [Sedimentisphaerales bacterium]|jgi:hypothetical protein
MSKEKKDAEIQGARTTAKGVIIAAIISAVALVVVALMNTRSSTKPENKRFFTLVSVKPTNNDINEFRLTIEVNGHRYSYPTKTVWANINHPSLPFSFPIEREQQYIIGISHFIRSRDGRETNLEPQPLDDVRWTGKLERRTYAVTEPLTIVYELHE